MPLLYIDRQGDRRSAMRLGWRPKVEGLEHVPPTGGAIFAGNHLSVADELFLGAVVPRHIAFWAKAEYFTGTGFRGWFTALGGRWPRRDPGASAPAAGRR